MNNIEIIIENPEQGIANYEPLKAAAQELAAVYGAQLVSPDAIKDAKADMAMLRKLAKTAADTRIKIEREHAAKIATVTKQLKEVSAIFTDAAAKIDAQVKEYDEQRKAARLEEIKAIYAEEIGDMADILPFDRLNRAEWINKTTTDKTIRGDIQTAVINAQAAIEQIRDMHSVHENAIIAAFLERLSLIDALNTKKRLEDMDAAMEKRRAEEEAARLAEAAAAEIKKMAEAETVEVSVVELPEPPVAAKAAQEDGLTMDFTFPVAEIHPGVYEIIPPEGKIGIIPEELREPATTPEDAPTMNFTFTVKNATMTHLEALTTFLEENGFEYTMAL